MEEQVIQCPTCNKRYRMKGNPPATFTCKNCQTVMDLSAFRQAEPSRAAPPVGGGRQGAAPHRRHQRRAGSAPRSRRRGGAAPAEEEAGGAHHHYTPRDKGPNMPLILGSLGAVVIALVLFFLYMQGVKNEEAEQAAKKKAEEERLLEEQRQRQAEQMEAYRASLPDEEGTEEGDGAGNASAAEAPKPEPTDNEDARPELREGSLLGIPIPEGKKRYRPSEATIRQYEWPEHVTAEERNKIEQAIETMIEIGGGDGREAEEYLVSLDKDQEDGSKFRAVPRLISQFKVMLDTLDMSDTLTMSKFMTLDRVLRKIDGMQERDFRDIDGININSTDKDVERVAKRWNWWYDLEKWRLRREPWDVRFDVLDDEPENLEAN